MDSMLTTRRRAAALIGAGVTAGAAGLLAGCGRGEAPPALHLRGATMGSTWSLRIAGRASPGLEAVARQAVQAAFDGVVARMSTFQAGSEVSRFNRHASREPFELSPDTLLVLERAREVAAASAGAFDVTVGPLVSAWGFGAGAAERGDAPGASELAALPVGWRQLLLMDGAALKAHPSLAIDLSGIAKGHAVDRAAAALEALGVERYMVEAGGEVRTRGLNAEGRPWQIGIERPDAWPPVAQRVVPLAGLALATSGDYRNFYEAGGRRVHHEIDPATRAPAGDAHGTLASVSVAYAECMAADAWATALFVLGRERGLALAEREGLAAHFIERDGRGGFVERSSASFQALAAAVPAAESGSGA